MFLFYTNPILIAAAVLPAIFLLVHVYRADKLEKEPAPLLISLVLYGIAATFIALVLERAGSFLLGLWFEEGSVAYNAIMYFGIAGRGIPPRSTASLTAWCTRCSSRWASRCGRISATC